MIRNEVNFLVLMFIGLAIWSCQSGPALGLNENFRAIPSPLCPPPLFPDGNPFDYWQNLALTEKFSLPVNPPFGQGYYNAQPFWRDTYHLGDDWNGVGGGNTDLGDTIYAIGSGTVFLSKDIEGGWGNVIRIVHKYNEKGKVRFYESLYAHCDTIFVDQGQKVELSQPIGTIGNANGTYLAHLHLEVRDSLGLPIGGGYGGDTLGYLDPSRFIHNRGQ